MQLKPWLWPDRTIGKRESRRLREEHNQAINMAHELADALDKLTTMCEYLRAYNALREPTRYHNDCPYEPTTEGLIVMQARAALNRMREATDA